MQEMQIWSLGWEELLEEEMANHFSILARKILQIAGYDWVTEHVHMHVLATVNNATINIQMHTYFWITVLCDIFLYTLLI